MPPPPAFEADMTATTNVPSRRGRPGDLRKLLLSNTLALLRDRNSVDFSLRELADRIGVTQPALYRHFASKDALLETLCIDGFDLLARRQHAAIDLAGANSWKRLMALSRAYIDFATRNPDYFRIMFELGVANAPHVTPRVLPAFEMLVSLVGECQRAGAIAPGNTRDIAIGVWAAVHGFASLLLNGPLGNVLTRNPVRAKRLEKVVLAILADGLKQAAPRQPQS
jgi:AcrR family transcriptional regulator